MTMLMLMVIILSTVTSVVNMRTSKAVAQIGPPQWVQVHPAPFTYNEFVRGKGSHLLTFLYGATIDDDARALQLTSQGFTSGNTNICQSLVIYSKTIPFQGIHPKTPTKVSTASFSTSFSFSLPSSFTHQSEAHFDFILMAVPANTSAKGALVNLSSLILSNYMEPGTKPPVYLLAVEYDMRMNKVFNNTNMNTSCIGTGIENVVSLARINLQVLGPSSPEDENLRYSWVDYNDASKDLEVRINNNSNKPSQPIMKKMIDLAPLYSNLMYVGFSSQTQLDHESRVLIHSWSFETHSALTSLMTSNESLSLALLNAKKKPIAPASSPAPKGVMAPLPAPAPVPTGDIEYAGNANNTLAGKAAYLGKVLGTTLSVLFIIMLILAILVGFSQFGFACVANPDDLIEMAFSTLGEFNSLGEQASKEEYLDHKLDLSSKEEESGKKSEVAQKPPAQANKHEPMRNYSPDYSHVLHGQEDSFGKGSLWGDSLNNYGSPKDEVPTVDTKTRAGIQERKPAKSFIHAMLLGRRRSTRSVKEPEEPRGPLGDVAPTNAKEQIATLIREAALVEEEVEATRYQYKELSEATNGFQSSNMLGGAISEGHAIFKGFLPDSATEIVVKVINIELLKLKSKEVRAEMSILSRLQHPNLVKHLGWCKYEGQFCIVYELSRGQSLDTILFRSDGYVAAYPWKRRFETITAIASALNYLHEGWQSPVIHRNVKVTSVIVESNATKSKLGDYGLSCLMDNQIETSESSSLDFQDEFGGPLAPEFVKSRTGTPYTDVYSFGVLCLETACQRQFEDHARAPKEQNLVEWVSYLNHEKRLTDAIEDDIMTESEIQQFVLVLRLSLMCVAFLPQERPTMKQVLQCLSQEIPFPPLPISKAANTLTFSPSSSDLGEENVSNWDDSITTKEDPTSFKNLLFENENEWADIDFSVGEAKSFVPLNQSSSWVDIHENILFTHNYTGNNSWVDVHDIDILAGNNRSSHMPSSQGNCSWVDVVDFSLEDIVQPISSQQGEENQSFGLEAQDMQDRNLWTEIPTLNLSVDLLAQSSHLGQPTSLEWVENSEVFNSSWANTGPGAKRIKLQEVNQSKLGHQPLATPRPLPSSPRVWKLQPIPIGSNLPPAKWPLPVPKLKQNSKPTKQILSLDVSHLHSLPSLQAKGTQLHPRSPSTPTSTQASTPSNLPSLDRSRGSHGGSHKSASTLLSSDISSKSESPSLLSSSQFPCSSYGNKKASSHAGQLADNPSEQGLSSFGSGSPLSRTSPMMEFVDLKARFDKIKHPRGGLLQKIPDMSHPPNSKSKFNPTSELSLFPPKWPLPLPKSNLVGQRPAPAPQVRSLVEQKKT